MIEFDQAVDELDWIPRPRLLALQRLGIVRVSDLLTHFPRRYEDRHQFQSFPREESDTAMCLCGRVTNTQVRRFGGWKKIFEVTLQELDPNALSQPLVCRWFNLHYVQKMIATDQQLVVFGKPRLRGKRMCMDHPDFEVIDDQADEAERLIHFRRITPIYPATEGLSQRIFRSLIYRALQELPGTPVPSSVPSTLSSVDQRTAIGSIHFPETWEQLNAARRHLVLSEFFAMQMLVGSRRVQSAERPGAPHCGKGKLVDLFLKSLPFSLTAAQKRVLNELRRDLAAEQPMNRLLQGDVGSGKTVVATAAMLMAVEAGYQAALMAPTQVLAEQHYAVLRQWLDPLGVRLALRTGARQEETTPLPLFNYKGNSVADGAGHTPAGHGMSRPADGKNSEAPLGGGSGADCDPQIVIGTHALLYDSVPLSRLGLAVIDEQHKFGVAQRARLTAREPAPDVLVMTATPIPRTLTMTVYGDLDVSTIDEMPNNRGKIVTAVRHPAKLGEVLAFIRSQLEAGRQVYVIYPLIEESGKVEVKAATAEYAQWQQRLHPFRCELLHGRLPAADKQAVMERFRRGESSALVSTTVIEVGIDVPNATMMLVENAERFGLAQLHQLRGRIGRGKHKSYCILLTSDESPETLEKLAVLEKTSNGFEIADADWQMRGPGDLLGTAQSGLPPLKLGDLRRDAELMRTARAAALQILESDPALELPQNKRFRGLTVEQGKTFSNVS